MRPLRFPHLQLFRRAQSTWRTRTPVTDRTHSVVFLGASAAVAGYASWRMTSGKSIALDAVPQRPSHTSVPLTDGSAPQLQGSSPVQSLPPHTPDKIDTSSPDASLPDPAAEAEEESGKEAAFNPDTGEINWDCPCLGGMAHGPCGMPFREAFSCFVFSEQEPKGIDCIEKFRKMQECFREHPDVYGEELMDDEEEEEDAPQPAQSSSGLDTPLANGDHTASLPPPSPSESLSVSAKTEAIAIPISNSSVGSDNS
ncbi:hypothetical protein BU17DRAFT_35621 [Hysterangium stoloniferum]|nr:hypothetical protein BU17DRAFT_35621 [Hysterangium stoloniferum]